jgi:hypothetical protein
MSSVNGNQALSWRQATGLLLFGAAAGMYMVAREQFARQNVTLQLVFWVFCAVFGVVGIVFLCWNFLIESRSDLQPDVLAAIVREDQIVDFEGLHLWTGGVQIDAGVRIVVVLQNVFAGPCTGRLDISPQGAAKKLPLARLPLEFELEDAEVVAYWRELPVAGSASVSFRVEGSLLRRPSARVRFKRRQALNRHGILVNCVLFLGGLRFGESRFPRATGVKIAVTPSAPNASQAHRPTEWQAVSLWSMQERREIPELQEIFNQLMKI